MTSNPKSSLPQHVSYGILEESRASPIERRYTSVMNLRVVSQNEVIDEPSQGVRTRSLFRIESNMDLILSFNLNVLMKPF